MVVRVGVVDEDSAAGLIPLLVKEVDAERICFETASQQLCIEIERNHDQAVVRIGRTPRGLWLDLRGATTVVAVSAGAP